MRFYKKLLALLLALVLITPQAYADMLGADIKVMMDVYLTLKKQLDEMKSQVEELKAANETIHDVRDTINDLNEQYRFIRDFDPKAEIRDLQSWGEGLTGLDDYGDAATFDQKWSIIQQEIDKRIEKAKKSDPHSAKKNEEVIEQLLGVMKENDRQLINYRNAARSSTNEDNSRYLQQLEASSSAMTASLLLEQKQLRMKEEVRRREVLLEQVQWEHSFLKYLSKE